MGMIITSSKYQQVNKPLVLLEILIIKLGVGERSIIISMFPVISKFISLNKRGI